MSTTPSPDRRFIVALTAAVASATLAIGATVGALSGWIKPNDRLTEPPSPAPSAGSTQVVYVPITPDSPKPSEPHGAAETADARRGEHEEDDDD